MFSALSRSAFLPLALLRLASIASADNVRLSLAQLTSIEPREWKVDKLWASFNLLTETQNSTQYFDLGEWPRGVEYTYTEAFQDFSLTGSEPYLTLSLAVYNVGDKDPQKVGLEITSQILKIPSRIPVLGTIALALRVVLDFFINAYQCEGPVAISAFQLSQRDLLNLSYDVANCATQDYSYKTGNGCANWLPVFSSKNSIYRLTHCVERLRGESTPDNVQSTPIEAQSTPVEAQSTPVEAQSTPVEAQSTPVGAQTTPGGAQTTLSGVQTTSIREEPTVGESTSLFAESSLFMCAVIVGGVILSLGV